MKRFLSQLFQRWNGLRLTHREGSTPRRSGRTRRERLARQLSLPSAAESLEERVLLSHGRYITMTWEPVSGMANTVDFHITESQRTSFFFNVQVGGQVQTDTIDFGDGRSASIRVTVTSMDVPNDYFVGSTTIRHTYSSAGNYTASIDGCCRLSTLENNSDDGYYTESIVNVGATPSNSSPVSSLPPIVTVADDQIVQFQVPGIDPDGDTLTYRLAQGDEGTGFSFSTFQEPTGLTISSTGLITWDIRNSVLNTSPGDLWNTYVVLEDGRSKTPLDFLIRIGLDATTNPPPTVAADPAGPFRPQAGVPMNFNVVATDPNGTIASLQALNPPTGMTFGTLNVVGNQATLPVSFTPTAAQATQSIIVTFLATDDQGSTASTSVTITPLANSPTVISTGGPYTFPEGGIGLLTGSASDADDDDLSDLEWDFDFDGVTFDVDATGSAVLFSAINLDGPTSRTVGVRVTDSQGVTTTASTTVQVVNVAPVINNISTNSPIDEDTLVNLSVSATDIAGTNDPLTYEFDFDNNGTFEVGPQSGNTISRLMTQGGSYPIVVRISDGDGGYATQTVTVVVNPVNDVPSGNPQTLSTNEDTGLPITLTGSDNDIDAVQTLTFAIASQPQFGTIINFDSATGQLTYVPNANYFGSDSFTFTVTDDGTAGGAALTSAPATITISVVPQNDAPTVSPIATQTTNEDVPTAAIPFQVSDLDSPLVGVNITALSSNQALVPNGNLVLGGSLGSRTLTITPLPDQFGTAVISLIAEDGVGGISTTTFLLNVNSVNDAPSFTNGADVSVRSDVGSYTATGWATNISRGPSNELGQTLQFQVVSNSNPALFIVTPTIDPTSGNLTFTPRGDQFGTSAISVRLRDNGGTAFGGSDASAIQTFNITITVPAIRRFEFNASPTLQTAGYTSVRGTDVYSTTAAPLRTFGWNSVVTEADRTTLTSNTLLRDGHYGRDNVFTADLPDGTYSVSLMLGDRNYTRDRLNVYANGVLVPNLTNVTTAAGQFIHRSFTTTVTGGKLALRLQDTGGDPFWMIHAVEIRPLADVNDAITLTRVNPIGSGALSGDGATTDTYQGTGATPNCLISVSTTAGTVPVALDQDSSFVGVQVRANSAGQFTFQVLRPHASGTITSSITTEEVSGARNGDFTQIYSEPTARLFDMNYGNSPTQNTQPYIGVLNNTLYTAARGYGWRAAVSGADRGSISAPDALLRDLAYGTDGTFRVNVNAGQVYTVTLRFRDTYAHDRINVYMEGSTTPVSPGLTNLLLPANTTVVQTFLASSNDGVLDLRFRDLSTTGDRNWIVNAIEIVRNTQVASTVGDSAAGSASNLTAEQLAPLVVEAKSRLAASGLSAAQLAAIDRAEFRITNIGRRDLGLTASDGVIYLDDNAAGHGWFIDSTPGDDREFSAAAGGLIASSGSAAGKMDLLTVAMHELIHLAGKSNVQEEGTLLSAVLTPGTRRNPAPVETDAAFSSLAVRNELAAL